MCAIPISLYVHIPWCIKKCPYCDFNSHVARQTLPENGYLQALLTDFNQQIAHLQGRTIHSVFIGGGTPSLFSAEFYDKLLQHIANHLDSKAEITLEANPGTIDMNDNKFQAYRRVGINRLSLGIQSLRDAQLKYLGRMHSKDNALDAIKLAQDSGFASLNCDLMFGLPQQTIDTALDDLQRIIALKPQHISWYQLTLEPNTHFYRRPPKLPDDDVIFNMYIKGQQLLSQQGYQQYEVSAYSQPGHQCQHNLNYWLFGDYIGIGAGAHGKITYPQRIVRTEHHKHPKIYQNTAHQVMTHNVAKDQYLFEFMLNALRLQQPVSFESLLARAFVTAADAKTALMHASQQHLVNFNDTHFWVTSHGKKFVDEILITL